MNNGTEGQRPWTEIGENKEKGKRRNAEAGTETNPAITFGVAEEATIASAGNNRVCSNGGC